MLFVGTHFERNSKYIAAFIADILLIITANHTWGSYILYLYIVFNVYDDDDWCFMATFVHMVG